METRLIAISRILQVLTNQMTKRLILACTHIKEIGRRRNSRNRQADQRGLSDSTVFCFVHYLFCTCFSCSVSFLSLSPGELHMKYSQKFAFYFHFLFFYMEESKPTSAGQRQFLGEFAEGIQFLSLNRFASFNLDKMPTMALYFSKSMTQNSSNVIVHVDLKYTVFILFYLCLVKLSET